MLINDWNLSVMEWEFQAARHMCLLVEDFYKFIYQTLYESSNLHV